MKEAAFNLKSYIFPKVKVDLSNYSNEDLLLDLIPSGIFDAKGSEFQLSFEVKVFNKGKKSKPFVEIVCLSFFRFKNVLKFEDIPDFFYTNSIAIIFPYIRAYLSILTSQANLPPIILPTYNLTSLNTELINNTTEK